MGDLNSDPDKRPLQADAAQLHRMSEVTIAHYDRSAEAYRDGTRDHDVSQHYRSLLDAIEGDPPHSILDLGCGPGRDLHHFRSLGHDVVGLDGSKEFVSMARAYSGCEVLHQDFLAMTLPEGRFDGSFEVRVEVRVDGEEGVATDRGQQTLGRELDVDRRVVEQTRKFLVGRVVIEVGQ